MEIKGKIGQRIRFLREQLSMSQKDLAYSADLDRSYIASVENGSRNISIVNIEKIAIALNIPLKEFFNATEFDNITGSSK
ncbi:MAG: helix-turn-helix transcriptional regulator [Odoribacter sp.]